MENIEILPHAGQKQMTQSCEGRVNRTAATPFHVSMSGEGICYDMFMSELERGTCGSDSQCSSAKVVTIFSLMWLRGVTISLYLNLELPND